MVRGKGLELGSGLRLGLRLELVKPLTLNLSLNLGLSRRYLCPNSNLKPILPVNLNPNPHVRDNTRTNQALQTTCMGEGGKKEKTRGGLGLG